MDTQIIASWVIIVAAGLSLFNIHYAGDLTQLVTAIITVIGGGVIWQQRTTLEKSVGKGDVGFAGRPR